MYGMHGPMGYGRPDFHHGYPYRPGPCFPPPFRPPFPPPSPWGYPHPPMHHGYGHGGLGDHLIRGVVRGIFG
jgi:hypothetical protein